MKRFSSRNRVIALIAVGLTAYSTSLLAHTDHDRGRFVAETGTDTGRCENRFRPCQSIAYATSQANKGDVVFVAEGYYDLSEWMLAGYSSNQLVTIRGGYSTSDHFQVQHPTLHLSHLRNVPVSLQEDMYNSGFTLIQDGKASQSFSELDKLASTSNEPQGMVFNQPCVNNRSSVYACNGISLLAHVPLSDLPTNSLSASDIWGHVDLNTGKEYAIIGLRFGVAVVDVTDTDAPQVVGSINGQGTTWRDIKVFQQYNQSQLRWEAWAYVTADSTTEGTLVIDLNDLENGISLASRETSDTRSHNVYISGVDYSLNIPLKDALPQVNILGSSSFAGAFRSYSLDRPSRLAPSYVPRNANGNDYTHDASSLEVLDSRAQSDCSRPDNQSCTVILDFNEETLRLWDQSNPSSASLLSDTPYENAEYTHSGWWSEDKRYVLLHDELDEQRLGLNTTVRVFDISSLTDPQLVSVWEGPTRAIDHNGFVRGNRYYMSNYERGLTILDISDPTAPTEIGYFDTYPNGNRSSFNGAWGVYPYLPSGNILVSDIQRGLFILKDDTQSDASKVAITPAVSVEEGQTASFTVTRENGTGAASVHYSVLYGSATGSDITATDGEITWAAGDNASKTIDIAVGNDANREADEQFFVSLHNAQNTYIDPQRRIATATITGQLQQGQAAILQPSLILLENQAPTTISVGRTGGTDGELTVELRLEPADAAADITVSPQTLTWANGSSESQTVTLTLVDDGDTEGEEVFTLVAGESRSELTVLDDESNTPPEASAGVDVTVNSRGTYFLRGRGSDVDGDSLSYLWERESGLPNTMFTPSTSPNVQLTAPGGPATLVYRLTVTDVFGAQGTDTVTISVSAPAQSDDGGSGGSLGYALASLLMVLTLAKVRARAH